MQLTFDTVEELKEFVKTHLKNPRNKAGGDDEGAQVGGTAPPPVMPPTGGAASGFPSGPSGFVPQGAGAGPMGGGFPAAAVTGPAPEVVALVNRIVARMNGAVQSGATKPDDMLTWFRGQCGPEAAAATIEQVQQHFLPRLPVPALEQIAKMMAA